MPPSRSRGSFKARLVAVHRAELNRYLAAHPGKAWLRAPLHLLLGALLAHCSPENIREDGRAVCWPSLKGVADTFGFPPRSIRRMLRELEDTKTVWVLNGSAVPIQDRGVRASHDGGFTRPDGSRVATSPRAYQYILPAVVPVDQQDGGEVFGSTDLPARGSVPSRPRPAAARPARTLQRSTISAGLPPLLGKRAEIEAEIGAAECEAFIAWVSKTWCGRSPEPSRPYDFWNARLPEWREYRATERATATANREVDETAKRARAVDEDHIRTAADRPKIAADLRERLATFNAEAKGVAARA